MNMTNGNFLAWNINSDLSQIEKTDCYAPPTSFLCLILVSPEQPGILSKKEIGDEEKKVSFEEHLSL